MKKRLSLIIVLIMCLTLLPVTLHTARAEAKDNSCGTNLTWSFDSASGTLTIKGSGAMREYKNNIYVPWYQFRSKIKSVVLPNGMTSICNWAFMDCSELTEITIPDSVETIGEEAFCSCTRMTKAKIGGGVTCIKEYAFWVCRRLETIWLGNGVSTIELQAFSGCDSLTDVYYAGTSQMRDLITFEKHNSDLTDATWHYLDETPDVTFKWNSTDVKFKGSTAYVIANGKEQKPRFTLRDENDNLINQRYYSFAYMENTYAGTGYAVVTFKNGFSGTAQGWFKIYLPATDYTMVENRDDGIYMEWHAVPGAAGYVIYRRAWSSTTGGWTDFVRWNNTTNLYWIDKTVYAGTRYQYGIKAYFERRVDPVSGATIGGNVGDNYNLGIVGPLKTTVRITTRKLNSVTGGSKQLTVKWAGSSLFAGYEVQIATDADFTKNVKTVKITDPKTYQTTIKSLKAKTTYYVRVRSYHVFEDMTYFGGWSNVLNAKTK